MISLHPLPNTEFYCPYDQHHLTTLDWHIPGMRCLVKLRCPVCQREFYGDLLAGHGIRYPMLLEAANATVYHPSLSQVSWFGEWLRDSYLKRSQTALKLSIESLKPINHPLILNCLDGIYGHALLKLLNVQYHLDKHKNYDIVLLIPSFLRWLVPDGVAEIWNLDIPLREGNQWNDWLDSEIKRRFMGYDELSLSYALPHPHPKNVDIGRFTNVKPFDIAEWQNQTPKVTFVWRDDRFWIDSTKKKTKAAKAALDEQKANLIELTKLLKSAIPSIEFAVCGNSASGNLPSWIQDFRHTQISEKIEREWLNLYASSHIVVGVIGSNMLLPSAHAGSVIDLIPPERLGNNLQDILMVQQDTREAMLRYTPVILPTSALILSKVIIQILKFFPHMLLNFTESNSAYDLVQKNERLHSTQFGSIAETWYKRFV